MTKLLSPGVLFSTAVNAEVAAEPLILGILFSMSVILGLQSVFLTSPLVSGIFLPASLIFFAKSDLSVSHLDFKTNLLESILFTLVAN